MPTLMQALSSGIASAITPHDTNALGSEVRAIYVGGDGNIVLRPPGASSDVTLVGVKQGSVLPVRATHVRSTGTTATGLVGLA